MSQPWLQGFTTSSISTTLNGGGWCGMILSGSTGEPCHTTTLLKLPLLYRNYLFKAWANSHAFPLLKMSLIHPPCYYQAYGDWMERKIQCRNKRTWPAYMLTLITCLSDGTSSLVMTCPCKNQGGWLFWCPLGYVDFSAYNHAQDNQLLKATGQNQVCAQWTQKLPH